MESLHSMSLCSCYHLLLLMTIIISILTQLVNEYNLNIYLFCLISDAEYIHKLNFMCVKISAFDSSSETIPDLIK